MHSTGPLSLQLRAGLGRRFRRASSGLLRFRLLSQVGLRAPDPGQASVQSPCISQYWRNAPPTSAPKHQRRARLPFSPPPPPAAGPHVVDDHGLVGDDVVGLHGQARPALPSRRAAGGTCGPRAGGLRTEAAPDAASRPSHPDGATYTGPDGLAVGRTPKPIIALTRAD